MVTAGRPYYAPLADMDVADAARYVADDVRLALAAARRAADTLRTGGTLLINTALTGATLDVDGGQQVVSGNRV